ncbi:MAG: domain S-box protein [Chitinophagaceae bacterium]|nr:domain S-box protein [Chitinophagaceae bacterium]
MEKILKILLLEDDLTDVDLIKRVLSRAGFQFQPVVASGKEDFIEAINNQTFDIILSDHSLPQFSSVEALDEIIKRNLDITFILVTGTVSEEFAVEMIQKGVDDYILKNNLVRLPSALTKAIEKRKIKNEKIIAETALRESELQYRLLFDRASDGIFISNQQGDLLDANKEACKMVGYELHELLQSNISDFFLKEDLESNPLRLTEVLAGNTILNQRRVKRKNGQVIDVETSTKILPDGRCQAIARDITERKKLEEEIRQSEVRFRALIENNTDAIVLRDENFSMTYCSPSAKRILGYQPEETMPASFDAENHPGDFEIIKKAKQEVYENPGKPVHLNYRKKHKAGYYIWVEGVITNMLRDESVKGIVSNFRDVTEKKKAEQEIQNSFNEIQSASARQSAILNSLQSNIALLDENGKIIEVNKAWKNFENYNDLCNGNFLVDDNYIEIAESDTGHEEQNGKLIAQAIRDITSGELEKFSIEYSCHSLIQKVWFRADIIPLYPGRRGGVVIAHTNITESKQSEEALRKSEEQFRRIVETAQEGIWLFDENFKTIFVNKKMCEIVNYSPGEMIGKKSFDFMEEEDKKTAVEAMKMQRKGINEIVELRFRTGGGKHIWASLSASVFLDKHGNYQGGLAMVTDVTRRKQIAEELQQSYKDIRELASHLQNIREEERIQIARDIHDELGQQLTGLKMDVSWLNSKLPVKEKGIEEKINGMTELLDEAVRSVRRISANLRPSILDDLGLEAALEWQSQEVQKRFGIQIKFKSEFPEIELPVGIATGLFRVYQEALTNAVRHANAHTINSKLLLSGSKIILEIYDDGKGMDLNAGPTKKSFGLLGIKERVFVMNGKYEIKSEPGKGTFLSVAVPL